MRLVTVLLIALIFGLIPAHAETESPPFGFPDEGNYQPIPEGMGMRFFQDKWHYIGRGGFLATTVTDKAFVNDETGNAVPYRVLVEASRYILLLDLWAPNPGSRYVPSVPWTNFVVLTWRGYKGENPYGLTSNMIMHSCSYADLGVRDQAFSWSLEKLMQVFKKSHYFKGIQPTAVEPFRDGWNGYRYQRRISPEGYQKRPLKWRQ